MRNPMEHEEKPSASFSSPSQGAGRPRAADAAATDDGAPEKRAAVKGEGAAKVEGAKVEGAKVEGAAGPEATGSEATGHENDVAPEGDAGEAAKKRAEPKKKGKRRKKGPGSHPNNVRKMRIERMMSKAELARRANLSVLTIDRVEKGHGCRMDTKRKILEALGLSLGDRVRVFGEEE